MRKINVAIVCDPLFHITAGCTNSTLRFADILSQKGNKVVIIAARYPGTNSFDVYKGLKIYRFRSLILPKAGGQVRIAFPTFLEIKNVFLKENIQILHVMLPTPAAIASIKAARHLGIKIVAHSHTQPENLTIHLPTMLMRQRINKLFYKYLIWLYKKADIVICPSRFADGIIKQYHPNLKTCVISNGVNLSKFKKTGTSLFFEKYGLSKARKKILFVGRLHPEKQVDTLIRALPCIIKEESNVDLYIVGGGYLMNHLKKISDELGIEEHVKFFGKIPDEYLVMAYNACDIFVLPSNVELEGMVVLEAMSCGKPIVIANSKDSASVDFVSGNGLLFKPGDPKDLAQKILVLLQDTALRKKMSAESYKKIKKFDINRSFSMLEQIYASLSRQPRV